MTHDGTPEAGTPLGGLAALVTGSSSGIGEAVAVRLHRLGASVAVNSTRSVDKGEAVAARLDRGIYVRADVADDADARRMVETVVESFGRLDILVNNAGTTRVVAHDDLEAITAQDWDSILGTNVVGIWNVTRAAVPHLSRHGAGRIINVTSVAGVRPVGSSVPYAVSKAAANHLTRLLARVLGPAITVNAVAPGLVDTPWTADWDEVRAMVRERTPLRRSADPEDVADAVVGLLESRYATGQVLVVDGGLELL